MYIGPWQEYRLAKIQDDAIQRIRQEWEDNIRAQLPNGDDSRIREVMQPLMAKLPALLMAKTSTAARDAATPLGTRKARHPAAAAQSRSSTRPSTAVSTASSTRSRAESVKSRHGQSNQETHEDETQTTQPRRPVVRQASTSAKPPKKKKAPTTAVEEVERRRKLFAKWMKAQQDQPAAVSSEGPPATESPSKRLPPIHSNTSRAAMPGLQQSISQADATRLPPLQPNALASFVDNAGPETSPSPDEPNLEDSVDEDEVNQLLNWTDTLLSPNALETSLAGLYEDFEDMG